MTTTYQTFTVNEDSGQITLEFPWVGNSGGYVHFETVNGTALLNSDYSAVPYTVYIPPNTTGTYKLVVNIVNDFIKESNEYFVVRSFNEGVGSYYSEYRFTVNIIDDDTGILQPDGSIRGPAKPGMATDLKSKALDAAGNFLDGMKTAYDSKYIADADIPAWEVQNVKYGMAKSISGPDVFNSMIDFNAVTKVADGLGLLLNTYKAYDDASKALAHGTASQAVLAGCSSFIIAVSSGEIGTVAGGAVMAGLALAGAPWIVGIGAGVLVGGYVAGTIDSYVRDLAKAGGILPMNATSLDALSATTTTVTETADENNIINPLLSYKAVAPTPKWTFDPVTSEFHWLTAPDPEKIREIATRLGFERVDPVNFDLTGDTASDVNDLMYGGSGQDHLRGLTGDDVLFGQWDSDTLEGGAGRDILDGGAGDDTLLGGDAADQLNGDEGNDSLEGGDGIDQLWGKAGSDTLEGGGDGDELYGGDGDDLLIGFVRAGGSAFELGGQYDGGNGWDKLSFETAEHGVSLQLDSIGVSNIEEVVGTQFADYISSPYSPSKIDSGDGEDFIDLGTAATTVDAGAGADKVVKRALVVGDLLKGGAGSDSLDATIAGTGADLVRLTGTSDVSVFLGPNTGTQVASAFEAVTVHTGAGNDTVDGSASSLGFTADVGVGVDSVLGGSGDDEFVVDGLATGDIVHGNGGEDTLTVIASYDYFTHGTTSDTADTVAIEGSKSLTVRLGFLGAVSADGIEHLNLDMGGGNDLLDARSVASVGVTLNGGSGLDTILGGTGDDELVVNQLDQKDVLVGGAGNDLLRVGTTIQSDNHGDWYFIEPGTGGYAVRMIQDGTNAKIAVADGFERFDLNAGGGADVIDAQAAQMSVTVNGGAGADVIWGGTGSDLIFGDDTYFGGDGNDMIFAGLGDDTVRAGSGADTVYGNAGRDEISVNGGTAFGGDDGDLLYGWQNADHLLGEAGADTFVGGGGNDTIEGGAGDDLIWGSGFPQEGSASIDGGDGVDTISWRYGVLPGVVEGEGWYAYKLDVDLAAHTTKVWYYSGGGYAFTASHTVLNVENVIGLYSYTSTLRGDDNANRLELGDVAGTVEGRGGNDVLLGGAAADLLDGGANSDTINGGGGDDSLLGGTGDDVIQGGAGSDTIDGGDGTNTADYSDKTQKVSVTLNGAVLATVAINDVAEDQVQNVSNIIGGSAGDALTGDGGSNRFRGGLGQDSIDGGAGVDTADYSEKTQNLWVTLKGAAQANVAVNDIVEDRVQNIENVIGGSAADTLIGDALGNTFVGNAGNDLLRGGAGNDFLDGGADIDTVDYSDKTQKVWVTLKGAALATVAVNDVAEDKVQNIENVLGGSGGDVLTGDNLNNSFRGGGGNDVMDGGAGSDTANYTDKTQKVWVTLKGATAATVAVNDIAEDKISNFENVTGGSGGDVLIGDTFGNILKGNDGNDVLAGGLGNDSLTGGLNADKFLFNTTIASNIDIITDFSHVDDTIQLENAIFTGLGVGAFGAAQFLATASGHAATSAAQRIIYDKSNGILWYDDDGNAAGGHAAVEFAILSGKPANLDFTDFQIV